MLCIGNYSPEIEENKNEQRMNGNRMTINNDNRAKYDWSSDDKEYNLFKLLHTFFNN